MSKTLSALALACALPLSACGDSVAPASTELRQAEPIEETLPPLLRCAPAPGTQAVAVAGGCTEQRS